MLLWLLLALEVMLIVVIILVAKIVLANPRVLWEIGPGLAWAIIFAVAVGYGLYLSIMKEKWTKSIYSEEITDELAEAIKKELDARGFKYRMRKGPLKKEFKIFSPCKGDITIRVWTHFRVPLNVPRGTIIMVKPHPSKASEEFKEVIRYALLSCGHPELAAEWY